VDAFWRKGIQLRQVHLGDDGAMQTGFDFLKSLV